MLTANPSTTSGRDADFFRLINSTETTAINYHYANFVFGEVPRSLRLLLPLSLQWRHRRRQVERCTAMDASEFDAAAVAEACLPRRPGGRTNDRTSNQQNYTERGPPTNYDNRADGLCVTGVVVDAQRTDMELGVETTDWPTRKRTSKTRPKYESRIRQRCPSIYGGKYRTVGASYASRVVGQRATEMHYYRGRMRHEVRSKEAAGASGWKG